MKPMKRCAGFTLIEILVVLAIISVLAALLFPVFKTAQEKSYQTSCVTALQQIGIAVQQYKLEEGRYPASIVFLLAPDAEINNVSSAGGVPSPTPVANTNGTGYLKVTQSSLMCPDDDTEASVPRSSYGDLSTDIKSAAPASDMGRYVWNYYGYRKSDVTGACGTVAPATLYNCAGTAFRDASEAAAAATTTSTPPGDPSMLVNPMAGYDLQKNPVNYSLSNRYAPTSTIITHCVYHRMPTTNLAFPYEVYSDAANGKDARDIVLRLDGTAKSMDITEFQTKGNWQKQNF